MINVLRRSVSGRWYRSPDLSLFVQIGGVEGFLFDQSVIHRWSACWRAGDGVGLAKGFGAVLTPFLAALGHKALARVCPAYVAGLIGIGERKSVQPMALRDGGSATTSCITSSAQVSGTLRRWNRSLCARPMRCWGGRAS